MMTPAYLAAIEARARTFAGRGPEEPLTFRDGCTCASCARVALLFEVRRLRVLVGSEPVEAELVAG